MALFYSDGGPGPATKLLRVNVDGDGSDLDAWLEPVPTSGPCAAAGSQRPTRSWIFSTSANTLWWMPSEVPKIQQGMREEMAKYRGARVNYIAELNGVVQQSFSNPYDSMAELFGTEGEADVYVIVGGEARGSAAP